MLRLLVSATLVAYFAISAPSHESTKPLSDRQLHRLERSAHTVGDYQNLTADYSKRAERYRALAQQQGETYRQAIDHPIPGGKFPSAAEIARRWKEFYEQKAEEAERKRVFYSAKLDIPPTRRPLQ